MLFKNKKIAKGGIGKLQHEPVPKTIGYFKVFSDDPSRASIKAMIQLIEAGINIENIFIDIIGNMASLESADSYPQLNISIENLKKGDTFIFSTVRAVGYDIENTFNVINNLRKKGISCKAITNEGIIDL